MRTLEDIRTNTGKTEIFRGQIQHVMIAALLTTGTYSLLRDSGGSLLGFGVMKWAYVTIAVALIHQIIVAVVFRLQLHLGLMTRIFGKHALKVWGAIFLPFLLGRPLLLLCVGVADMGSLECNRVLQLVGGVLLLLPAGWAVHSVLRYFGIGRALGGDHFFDRFLNMPLVKKGAFSYSSNAMYSFVFLGLWGMALLCGSWNALVLALFQHAYIWVHMYCTEGPDMEIIYGRGQANL
jgi:hypothetical protein